MRQFQLLTFPHYVFWTVLRSNLSYTFLWIAKNYLYLSKLASPELVTSTPSENSMNLRIKMLILVLQRPWFYARSLARSIFLKGVTWSAKYFSVKPCRSWKLWPYTYLFWKWYSEFPSLGLVDVLKCRHLVCCWENAQKLTYHQAASGITGGFLYPFSSETFSIGDTPVGVEIPFQDTVPFSL
jgi:hypothetical protein